MNYIYSLKKLPRPMTHVGELLCLLKPAMNAQIINKLTNIPIIYLQCTYYFEEGSNKFWPPKRFLITDLRHHVTLAPKWSGVDSFTRIHFQVHLVKRINIYSRINFPNIKRFSSSSNAGLNSALKILRIYDLKFNG